MNKDNIRNLWPEATDEQVKALLDINSADITHALNKQKNESEQLEAQIKTLNGQLEKSNGTISNLKAQHEIDIKALNDKHSGDINGLQEQLKAAQERASDADALTERVAQLTKDVADRDAKIAADTKNYRVKDALRALKAKNVDIVMSQLHLDKIGEKDGELTGLAEQVEALKKSDAYLFDSNSGAQRGGFSGAQETGGAESGNAAMNTAIRAMSGRR